MTVSVLLLIADDDQAAAIQAVLAPYIVIRCSERKEALEHCRHDEIRLALIEDDPSKDKAGDFFTSLREIQPGLIGILLASVKEKSALQLVLEAGFSGFVELPIQAKHLERTVRYAVDQACLQEENTRLRTLIPLYRLGEQFISSATEQQIFDGLLDAVEGMVGAANISLMLYNQEEACLQIAAARGMDKELAASIRLQPGDQIAGWVFQKGKSVILNREDQQNSIFAPLLKRLEIVSAISFPLAIRGQILGVLNISQTETDARFSEADNEMLAIVCSQAAMAMENVRSLRSLKETTRMRTLFEQYVSPEVADLLIAQDSNLLDLGEIKQVTVLFADIRNFTGLVQQLNLEDLRTFLNDFFQLFTETVFQSKGTVDKFMGDAVLAVFGAPVMLENANLTAAKAALTIKKRFERLRDYWAIKNSEFGEVDLGIAVTCGEVFLGNVGSSKRLDYTVIGNQVNIAQRLAAESSDCSVLVTDLVQKEIHQHLDVQSLGEMKLRGVEKKTQVYSIDPGVRSSQ